MEQGPASLLFENPKHPYTKALIAASPEPEAPRLMIFDKPKLYEIGGTRHDEIQKWSEARKGPKNRQFVSVVAE